MVSTSKWKKLTWLLTGVVCTCFVAAIAFAADADAVLGQLDVTPQLPPGAGGDTTADAVLGQLDFTHSVKNQVDGRGVNLRSGDSADVAIDTSVTPNRVYVADRANSRVLGWSTVAAFATHAAADIVIGQPDFTSIGCNNGGVRATSLCNPDGVAVDAAGNLYVADTSNHRVLQYQRPFRQGVTTGLAAADVIGQFGSFTTNFCNGFGVSADSLCNPARVTLDRAGNLYVADFSNNRVLEYNTPGAITAVPGSGDTTADRVFGQNGSFTSNTCNLGGVSANSLCQPVGLAVDRGRNLYVGDLNNNRVLAYNTPLTAGTTADRVFGQTVFTTNTCNKSGPVNATTLCRPSGVAVDNARNLYVTDKGNNRVLEYNTPLSAGTTADRVFGQFGSFVTNLCNNTNGGNFPPVNAQSLCQPAGVAVDSAGNVYVIDAANSRVLSYNTPLTSNVSADGVVGQALLTTNTADFVDGRGVDFAGTGGVAIDRSVNPNRVYVADPANHRVLAWNTVAAFITHAPATLVFGQPTLFENTLNQGGPPSRTSLNQPRAVAVDSAGNLYVADQGNHRVLQYNTPFTAGTAANRVFGQAGSFTTNFCNKNGLSASSLCTPVAVTVDTAGNLYVGDFSNNRVLEYHTPLTTNTIADRVFGQGNVFTTNTCNKGGAVSADTLCGPAGVAADSAGNLYVADVNNHRVLEYNTPLTTNRRADRVFGQDNTFTTNTCNIGGLVTAATLCLPRYVAVDSLGNLYVTDTNNNRVLQYTRPLTTNTTADRVFGQGNLLTQGSCKSVSPNTLCTPDGVAVDGADNLYVADTVNNRVLKFNKP